MELLYHYLWKFKMMNRPLATTDGRPITIINPGIHNDNSGPDFSNARLKIGSTEWMGNVEIHVNASDWVRHGHNHNPAYDSVILHVVAVNDAAVCSSDGREIPQCVVTMPREFYMTYSELTEALKGVRCRRLIPSLPPLVKEDWLESLAFERLEFKARRILDYYSELNSDWEQTMFCTIARALGFGLNGLPFEMLAKHLPLKYIYHHSDNLLQIEALLFGLAGMLDSSSNIFDDYYQSLCREFCFLAGKYNLRPMRGDLWKYARTRPGNFPHRRIAILASALHQGIGFTNSLLTADGDIDMLMDFFNWQLSGYWKNHGSFGELGREIHAPSSLSRSSRESMLINVAAPFYFAYSHITGNYDMAEKGLDILSNLNPEKNSVIADWNVMGLKAADARRSQALLHLRSEYCNQSRCLDCRFGYFLLRINASACKNPNPQSLSSSLIS